MKTKVQAWSQGLKVLIKMDKQQPQLACSRSRMYLQLEWQYPQITVPGVGTLMGRIEQALRETFLPALFGGEEVDTDFRKILVHIVKLGGLGITDHW